MDDNIVVAGFPIFEAGTIMAIVGAVAIYQRGKVSLELILKGHTTQLEHINNKLSNIESEQISQGNRITAAETNIMHFGK